MTQDTRICFVGDSFVNGTGDETMLGWAGRLCAAARRHMPLTYYNLGVRRDTSHDIFIRWKQECMIRLPEGCDARIVFSCGVNDTIIEGSNPRVPPENSCLYIREILRAAAPYRVLMVGPPPVAEADQNNRIGSLSKAFSREAQALGVPYIELFSYLASDEEYQQEVSRYDGAHPGSHGYEKITHIIASSPHWWFHRS